jgi:hypothetical protein
LAPELAQALKVAEFHFINFYVIFDSFF